jgi:hypothetical protein
MIKKLQKIINKIINESDTYEDTKKHIYFFDELILYVMQNKKSLICSEKEEARNLHCLLRKYSHKLYVKNVLLFSKYISTENIIRELLYGESKIVYLNINTDDYAHDEVNSDYRKGMHTVNIKGLYLEIKIPEDISIIAKTYFSRENVGFLMGEFLIPSGTYIVKITDGYNSSTQGNIQDERQLINKNLTRGLIVSFAVSSFETIDCEDTNFKFIKNIEDFNNNFDSFKLEVSVDDDWITNEILIYGKECTEDYENLKPWLAQSEQSKALSEFYS